MKVDPLNVIIINDFANINGGAAKVAIDTAIGLRNIGANVQYFCSVGKPDRSLENANQIAITHLNQQEIIHSDNKIKALLRGIWNIKAYKEIKKVLTHFDRKNTIIHIHGWTKSLSISPIIAALNQGFTVVITLHDFFIYCPNGGFYIFPQKQICHKTPLSLNCIFSNCDSRSYSFKIYRVIRSSLQRFMFRFYKHKMNLITLSKLSRDVLHPYIKHFKATYYIENPVDTYPLPKVNAEKNTTCVFIGRLSAEKGVEYFCEALKLLSYNDAVIVGEGGNKSDLEIRYPSFHFVGWQNKQQIKDILQKARFLVFPSVMYETYGLVVQEASSYGIPCIASDCTAATEIIDNHQTGLIFRSKDTEQLAELMQMLLSDDAYTAKLSRNAYNKFWEDDHSIYKYSRNVNSVYKQILGTEVN